jgi:hypothetical protein
VWLSWLVSRYGVDVPYNDQWAQLPLFEKAFHGGLRLQDLWEPHNEHRIFFPRLVFLGLARLSHWNIRLELAAIVLAACAISRNLGVLLRRTWPGERLRPLLLCFLVNLCVFSPVQHQNWLWGFQLQFLAPIVCVTTVLALPDRWGPRRWALAAAPLCLVSTFSLGSGFLAWPATLPVWLIRFPAQARIRAALLWLAGLAACLALYLHGYAPPHHTFPDPPLLQEPRLFASVFLGMLGQPMATAFRKAWLAMAIALGASGLGLFVALLMAIARSPALRARRTTVAWACLGTHALLGTGLVTFGRAGAGVESAFASRYTTLALYFWVSAFALVLILARERSSAGGGLVWSRIVPSLACALLLAWSVPSARLGRDDMEGRFVRMSQGKAHLVLAPLFQQQLPPDYLGMPGMTLLEKSAALDGLGLLRPAAARNRELAAVASIRAGTCGSIDEAYPERQRVRLLGAAWLPDPRLADEVLLTYRTARSGPTVFAWAREGRSQPDLARALHCGTCIDAGWEARFHLPDALLPAVVEAWAYDVTNATVCRLDGSYRVDASS